MVVSFHPCCSSAVWTAVVGFNDCVGRLGRLARLRAPEQVAGTPRRQYLFHQDCIAAFAASKRAIITHRHQLVYSNGLSRVVDLSVLKSILALECFVSSFSCFQSIFHR